MTNVAKEVPFSDAVPVVSTLATAVLQPIPGIPFATTVQPITSTLAMQPTLQTAVQVAQMEVRNAHETANNAIALAQLTQAQWEEHQQTRADIEDKARELASKTLAASAITTALKLLKETEAEEARAQKRAERAEKEAEQARVRERKAEEAFRKAQLRMEVEERKTAQRYFKEHAFVVKTFPEVFRTLPDDSLPMKPFVSYLNDSVPLETLRHAFTIFRGQVETLLEWQKDGKTLFQQGMPGFNRRATKVLKDMNVDGGRTCFDPTHTFMLHQATMRALLNPWTPMQRSLVLHPTGTGKSTVLLNVRVYFHDPRPKVVFTPNYLIQMQYVSDMLERMPSDSRLRQWYEKWKAIPSNEEIRNSRGAEHAWHVIAGLGFKQVQSTKKRTVVAHGDEDDTEVEYDTGEANDDARPPLMKMDHSRFTSLEELRKGVHSPEHFNLAWELRAPIVFITYEEHKLMMYRETRDGGNGHVFRLDQKTGPVVHYDNKIVLLDRVHLV